MRSVAEYFPNISPEQKQMFVALESLYREWNEKINVISRKDIENFYKHHVLHSLSIARVISFESGDRVLDVGTGGGFPGIPLAILFPQTKFHLVDSIGKKIRVVEAVRDALGLLNVTAEQARVETLKGRYDFIVSRAVTALPEFYGWVRHIWTSRKGIYYIKGGDISQEINALPKSLNADVFPISNFFNEDFFTTKNIVHIYK
ncbi:MAG: 16S rRNA (guanine(527)-N(7))-methyltransferase RsmG [Bacteroidales bacterium]|nr:16S rRNA (guanine(527)-N(7))-methyltransferase RsmG [Bacteroidales bacterium]